MNEPWWIVLMTERRPPGDGPARVFVLVDCLNGKGHRVRKPTASLREATFYTREDAESEARFGYPGYCLTAVPIGPGVPGLAWEDQRTEAQRHEGYRRVISELRRRHEESES